jgi:addiction module RelE/StbE family toxin
MAEISWTAKAKKDLRLIHAYIAGDSVFYAGRFIIRILERVEVLENFPLSGRIVPEKDDESIRELIEGNYRIFYKVTNSNSAVFILRIHHSAKLVR